MLVGLIAGLAGSVSAYEPLVVEGRIWEYASHSISKNALTQVRFQGTATVNGTVYHRLVVIKTEKWDENSPEDGVMTSEPNEVIALMREENKKVYICVADCPDASGIYSRYFDGVVDEETNGATEILLYDFSLPVGAEFNCGIGLLNCNKSKADLDPAMLVPAECTMGKTGSSEVGGKATPTYIYTVGCLEGRDFDYNADIEVVEGIGPAWAMWNPKIQDMPSTTIYYENLNGVYDAEGKPIYGEFYVTKPSGVDSIAVLDSDGRMYDLMGREIREPQRGTVYIQDGRKKVQR